ncbi:MAG: DMT family transporter [Notoacmeibacter sp.]
MVLWIPITILAAFLQNIRSILQRQLKGRLGASGATLVRFFYGIPVAITLVLILHFGFGAPLPKPNSSFAVWVMIAGLSQIAAQVCLLMAFDFRNFTAATAYSRTEPVHAALIGFMVLGERPNWLDGIAILLAVAGVSLISVAREKFEFAALARAFTSKGALYGLASGAIFGLSAVSYRTASLEIEGPGFLMQASVTLFWAVLFQSIVLLVFMGFAKQTELKAVFVHWRPGLLVGCVGAFTSFLWFAAMTLQQAAIVKALAQIEMIFTYLATIFIFRENVNIKEVIGCMLIIAGILALLY